VPVSNEDHALSYGPVAEVYDQVRPTYPAGLFAHIAAQLPGPRVLEVGAGSGLATRGLIARGLDVTCVEPVPEMAAVLARRAAAEGTRVHVEVATFESAEIVGPFDGLVSAQAWHWTNAATRLDRAAPLLRPGGFLGLFWNSGVFAEPRVFNAIESVYDDFGLFGRDRPNEPIGSAERAAVIQDPRTWPGDEMAAHPAFDYQGATLFPWQRDYTADEFADFLRSTSFYQVLDPVVSDNLVAEIRGAIRDDFGGGITINWSAQCYNARRR
jgi:SAM-dependent methyltransferase